MAASGVNINWGDGCWSDAGHANSLTWACDDNAFTGVHMTCSFAVAQSKTNFVAIGLYLEGLADDWRSPVPDWWKLGWRDCRQSQLTMSVDGSLGGGACPSPWVGVQGGGIGDVSHQASVAHLNASWAMPEPAPLTAGVEYFGYRFRIGTAKTVGVDACGGCAMPFAWGLNMLMVAYQGELQEEILSTPLPGGNQCLSWQSGAPRCGQPIPVRNTTWGQIKGMYR